MPATSAQIQNAIQASKTYQDYMQLMQELVQSGQSTGAVQSEALTNYTLLNNKRMQRLNKTLTISDKMALPIAQDQRALHFLVLSESWCGDAAQSLPMLNKIVDLNALWSLSVVSRDAHLELMDQYLTLGGRSIPKVLICDQNTLEVIAHWGPRPTIATQMVADYKAAHGGLDAAFKQSLQLWYNKDKGQSTLADILALLGL